MYVTVLALIFFHPNLFTLKTDSNQPLNLIVEFVTIKNKSDEKKIREAITSNRVQK